MSEHKPGNQIYYFEIGPGTWRGQFRFRIVDRGAFRAARLGFVNRCLCLLTHWLLRLLGPAHIGSHLRAFPDEGEAGTATNDIFMKKLGLVIYRQVIRYLLHADGEKVTVKGWERHGPIPGLLQHNIEHWGVIEPTGMRSRYTIPMLGDSWTAEYTMSADRKRIESQMRCAWGEAGESLERVDEGSASHKSVPAAAKRQHG